MFDHRATLQAFVERIPLGRGGEPDEVAEAVRFLAGPESKFVTGQTISVDGGLELRGHPDLGPLVEAIYGAQAVRSARAGRVPHQ
jgi:enoyl-[acyl-carrier-protein] reductase (NADH)